MSMPSHGRAVTAAVVIVGAVSASAAATLLSKGADKRNANATQDSHFAPTSCGDLSLPTGVLFTKTFSARGQTYRATVASDDVVAACTPNDVPPNPGLPLTRTVRDLCSQVVTNQPDVTLNVAKGNPIAITVAPDGTLYACLT
jgi:hypothetical protein